ncbi:MAG: ABC transporter permease [Fusobacteriaceae bacterium]|jgi:ribose transport system permease protein|nr:ABC transporter permease [Fusobacteriaceae bacterium]
MEQHVKTGDAGLLKKLEWSEHTTGLGFVLLFLLATIVGWPNFLQARNLINILRQQSYTGIIALGMTLVVISGGIDLSVGSMMAFTGGITIFLLNTFPPNSLTGVIVAAVFVLILGAVCGFVNGFLITKCRIAPFITTLGTMSIFRSLIQYFSGASNILSKNTLYPKIGSGFALGIPVPVWVFLILAVAMHFLLNNTSFGRYVCAVGANEMVARYSAISVLKVKLIPYVITGFTVGVTALMWSTRINCIQSSGDGTGYELEAVAAVVIGGTSMSGGKGSIVGTVLGALMLGMINNMLVLGGVSSFLQQAVRGLVIIAAVLLQYNRNNK